MEFDKVIKKRTACRKFTEKEVEQEKLDHILSAGNLAPTAKNIQPQKIYVVRGKNLSKIDEASPCRYGAPVVLVVCADKSLSFEKDGHLTYEVDASIVATHMMLEATNLGVDNIWIEMFDTKKLKEVLKLEDKIEPVCLIPLGYASKDYKGNPHHNMRKPLEETVIYCD